MCVIIACAVGGLWERLSEAEWAQQLVSAEISDRFLKGTLKPPVPLPEQTPVSIITYTTLVRLGIICLK